MGRVYPRYPESAESNARRVSNDSPSTFIEPSAGNFYNNSIQKQYPEPTINMYNYSSIPINGTQPSYQNQKTISIPVSTASNMNHIHIPALASMITTVDDSYKGSFDNLEAGFGCNQVQKPSIFGRIKQGISSIGNITAQAEDVLVGIQVVNEEPIFQHYVSAPIIPGLVKVKLPETTKVNSSLQMKDPLHTVNQKVDRGRIWENKISNKSEGKSNIRGDLYC
ncbi:hypothetical protein HK096_001905 [Nowakowskiella sp. JEL0078]|nr:hypothetical protein HK096_001905 [Nowakowskiella sp. JEL0078]